VDDGRGGGSTTAVEIRVRDGAEVGASVLSIASGTLFSDVSVRAGVEFIAAATTLIARLPSTTRANGISSFRWRGGTQIYVDFCRTGSRTFRTCVSQAGMLDSYHVYARGQVADGRRYPTHGHPIYFN